MAAALAAGLAWFAWQAHRSADVAYLASRPEAQWITYPYRADLAAQRIAALPCEFRYRWRVEAIPQTARVKWTALRSAEVLVNARPLAPEPGGSAPFKRLRTADAAGLLRPGENEIRVRATNPDGPPAVWLLGEWSPAAPATSAGWEVSWAGSHWQPARPVDAVGDLRLLDPVRAEQVACRGARAADESTHPAALVWRLAPWLAGLAGVALGLVIGAEWWLARTTARLGSPPRGLRWLVAVIAMLWVILVVNNAPRLAPGAGFDGLHHLAYVEHLRSQWSLPRPEAGYQMYQPPLYHGLVAAGLAAAGATMRDPAATWVVRLLGLGLAVAQVALVAGCLKRLFPEHPRRQIAGTLFAAALPIHLYLYQYLTNEALWATLASAVFYLGLVSLGQRAPDARSHLVLGLVLGAALLAKSTSLVLAAVVMGVLAGRLALAGWGDRGAWLRGLVLPVLVALAVGGWFYARVWWQYGKPVITNTGDTFRFWQYPGYRTLELLLHFGDSLRRPFFAGFLGCGDAFYATLWGDSLLGGELDLRLRPPWNYEWMGAGYLLAVAPALLIVVGLVAAIWQWIRRPAVGWFLLLAATAALAAALAQISLAWPFYSVPKAHYVAALAVPLSAAAGWGFDLAAGRSRWQSRLAATLLIVWALAALAAFFIRPSAATETILGYRALVDARWSEAAASFQRALVRQPAGPEARFGLALAFEPLGLAAEAQAELEQALQLAPDDPEIRIHAAELAAARGELPLAIAELQAATRAAPESVRAWLALGRRLAEAQRRGEAIDALRSALDAAPTSGEAHFLMAELLAAEEHWSAAAEHYRAAVELRFATTDALARLQWVRAQQEAISSDPSPPERPPADR